MTQNHTGWLARQLIIVCAALTTTAFAAAAPAPDYIVRREWELLVLALIVTVIAGAVIGLFGGVPKEMSGQELWPWPVRLICGLMLGFLTAVYLIGDAGLTPVILLPAFFAAMSGQFLAIVGQRAIADRISKLIGGDK